MANALAAKYSTRSTGLRLDSATLMISMPSIRARSFPGHRLSVCILAMLAFSGCQSVPPEKAMDISEPGWTVRQGRATWKLKPTDPGISGELVVATHWNGRSVVRFNRASQPLIAVQSDLQPNPIDPVSWRYANVASATTQGAEFSARIRLSRDYLSIEGKQVQLTSGLSAVADIRTGSRAIITWLLSPLQTTASQAGRER